MVRWQDNVPKRYTKPHLKVMTTLQNHGFRFKTEAPVFVLSNKRGDHVIPDVYLLDYDLRVECDSEYFHRNKRDKEKDRDARLLEKYGVPTIRLENRKVMLKSGGRYILKVIEEKLCVLGQ